MSLQRILTVLFTLSAIATSASANEVDDAVTRAMAQVNRRLDALENQNQELAAQVAQLTRQNETLRAQASTPASRGTVSNTTAGQHLISITAR